jgi:hypothetical protein
MVRPSTVVLHTVLRGFLISNGGRQLRENMSLLRQHYSLRLRHVGALVGGTSSSDEAAVNVVKRQR